MARHTAMLDTPDDDRGTHRGDVRDLIAALSVYRSPPSVSARSSSFMSMRRVVTEPLMLGGMVLAFSISGTILTRMCLVALSSTIYPTLTIWTLSASLISIFVTAAFLKGDDLGARFLQRVAGRPRLDERAAALLRGALWRISPALQPGSEVVWQQRDAHLRVWCSLKAGASLKMCLTPCARHVRLRLCLSVPGPPRSTPWLWWQEGDRLAVSHTHSQGVTLWHIESAAEEDEALMELLSRALTLADALSERPGGSAEALWPVAIRPASALAVEPERVSHRQALVTSTRAAPSSPTGLWWLWLHAWSRAGSHLCAVAAAWTLLGVFVLAATGGPLLPALPILIPIALATVILSATEAPPTPYLRPRPPRGGSAYALARLEVLGDTLSLDDRRHIDLSRPFSVGLTRGHGLEDDRCWLGVELRQARSAPGRPPVRLRFQVPASRSPESEALPELDMAAPVLDAEVFRAWLWPLIRHRAAVQGQRLPSVA